MKKMNYLIMLMSVLMISINSSLAQCTAISAPITETFDADTTPGCWTQYATTGGPWEFGQQGSAGYDAATVAEYTGNGGYYAWIDFSTPDAGVVLETPEIDVSSISNPELSFYMYSHNTLSSDLNILVVEAYDGSTWNNIAAIQEDNGAWTQYVYVVTNHIYSGNLVKFRFRGEPSGAGAPYNNDLLLDNFSLVAGPTCPAPSNYYTANLFSTTLDLGWSENGSATNWQIEYGATGFAQGSGTLINTTSNPHSLSGLTPSTPYDFYIRAVCGAGDSSTWYGPINIVTAPSCPQPDTLTVQNVTGTTAEFGWSEMGSATNWQIEWGIDGFTQGTGAYVMTTNNPETVSGLSGSTDYQYYVRAVCGTGDTSSWSGPINFSTSCVTITPYYHQNFGTFVPNCWDEADDGNLVTGPTTLGTSAWTSSTALGDPSARVNLYTNSRSEWMLSPMFDLSAGGYEIAIDAAVTDWNGSTSDAMGADDSVQVYYTENGTVWNRLVYWTVADALPNTLTTFTASISSTSSTVQFGILATDGPVNDAEDYDFHIDNFIVRVPPTCPATSATTSSNLNATSVDIAWTENGSATTWEIEYGTTGFAIGSGTTIVTTSNPYNVTGLSSGTQYDFYIRAICGAGDTSVANGPYSITTTPDYCAGDHFYDSGGPSGQYGNNENQVTVICPSSGGAVSVSFNSFNTEAGYDDLTIYDGSGTGGTVLGTFDGTTNPPDFTSTDGSGCLTFEFSSDGSVTRDGWDATITCNASATCPQPSSLVTTNITGTSADLGWTENGSATTWEIEYDSVGFTQGNGTLVSTTSNPHAISGLVASSSYDFYVRSICGAGDTSAWSGPHNFNTACATFTAPFVENFDSSYTPTCWSQSATTGGPWEFGQLGSAGYDAAGADEYTGNGGYYAWVDFSTPDAGVILETPLIDVSALTVPELAFYLYSHNTNSSDLNTLEIEAYDGTTWNTVGTIQEDNGGWTRYAYIVSSHIYNGNLVKFRLRAEPSSGTAPYYNDLLLDNFTVDEAPSCPQPSSLMMTNIMSSSVDFGWTENGSATTWEIEYGVAGFTQGSGIMVSTTSNPHSLSGLTPNTSYDFYVRSICGAGDSSMWSGPQNFTTACVTFTAPFVENFDNPSTPTCWSQSATTGGPWEFGQLGSAAYDAASANEYTGNGGYYAWVDFSTPDAGVILETPLIDVSALTVPELAFYLYSHNTNSSDLNTLEIEAYDGTTWNTVGTIQEDNGGWTRYAYIVSSHIYNGNLVKFRLRAEPSSGTAPYYNDLLLDNFIVDEAPTCPQPSSLTTANVSANGVDLGWTENGSATTWEIEYGVAGFTQGNGTIVSTTTNPHTLSTLNSGTTYDFYVRSVCGAGDSSMWVGSLTFTTSPDYCAGDHFYDTGGPNGQYSNNENETTVICGSSSSETVTVSFNTFDTEAGFDDLAIYDGNGTGGALLGTYDGTTLPPNHTATDATGCLTFVFTSDGSATRDGWDATITCANLNCPTPDSVSVSNLTGTSADISWIETGSATSWLIEYDSTGFVPGTGSTMVVSTNPATISGLSAGTTYDFYVRALCGGGDTSALSTTVTGSTSTDGIENVLNSHVKVYPNPTTGLVMIEVDNFEGKTTIELISITGEVVTTTSIASKTGSLDITDLPSGLYTLKMINGDQVMYSKLMKE